MEALGSVASSPTVAGKKMTRKEKRAAKKEVARLKKEAKTAEKEAKRNYSSVKSQLKDRDKELTDKTADARRKRDGAKDVVEYIGYNRMYQDGICEVEEGLFSSSIAFDDTSYHSVRDEQQKAMFSAMTRLYDQFGANTLVQMSVINTPLLKEEVGNRQFFDISRQSNDAARHDAQVFNDILNDKVKEGVSNIRRNRYLTYSVTAETADDAARQLSRIETESSRILNSMGSKAHLMNGTQRLSVIHSLLNPYKPFYFDYQKDISAKRVQTTKDCIAPTQIDFKPDGVLTDCFKLDNGVYGQVLVMKKFGSELSDRALADIVDLPIPMAVTWFVQPIAAIEGKPYPLFKTCAAHPEYTAEKLRLVRHLMEDAKGHDIPVRPEWLDLTGGQISELSYAIKMDVPPDALERYATGEYPAVNMSYITMALTDGMEQAQVERLMNPKLDGNQSLRIYSALLGGSLTDAQLDFLCRPELPAPMMEAAYQGLAFGNLDLATVERYAVPAFSPEQMHAIFDAAASDEVTQVGLDVLADPQLTPQQMKTLQFDLEGGMQPLNAARAKGQMLSANHRPDKAAPDGSLRSAAKESRDASSQLQSAERSGERANEQEEIW